ncbi:hypothetical protein BYT27DRAFT_7193147 [Phlegmacium glaucopus]|nr:hypothetical protein BYT27DRAFT_7193147 [Phlegmacium glaucopus]
MFCRERRSWTAKEDQLLRDAVQREDPDNSNPSRWHAIAKHVPNRTNKDCRKRWFAKMASDVVKGGWAPDEDEKLVKGIERYGTRWSLVASVVQTRNSDQCAKRWTDTLNPAIDRTTWSSEADELLLRAVAEHGKVWTKIVKTYFPGRTGLSAKNRYNSITRFNSDLSRGIRPRRKSTDSQLYHIHRKSESVSSSSSASPASPPICLPSLSQSPFQAIPENNEQQPYHFETFSTSWSSSSSVTSEDLPSFRSSPNNYELEYVQESNNSPSASSSPPSIEPSYQPFDLAMNHTLSYSQSPTASALHSNGLYKPFSNQNHIQQQQHDHTTYPGYSQFPLIHGSNDDSSDHHFTIFGGLSQTPIDPSSVISMQCNWDPTSLSSPMTGSKGSEGVYKVSPHFTYVF